MIDIFVDCLNASSAIAKCIRFVLHKSDLELFGVVVKRPRMTNARIAAIAKLIEHYPIDKNIAVVDKIKHIDSFCRRDFVACNRILTLMSDLRKEGTD